MLTEAEIEALRKYADAMGMSDAAILQAATRDVLSQAAQDVLSERQRQVTAEGWTPEHDDEHNNQELAAAAACYALCAYRPEEAWVRGPARCVPPKYWPWVSRWWKPQGPRRDLVKAGALIIAEIERIDRAAIAASVPKGDGND